MAKLTLRLGLIKKDNIRNWVVADNIMFNENMYDIYMSLVCTIFLGPIFGIVDTVWGNQKLIDPLARDG